MAAALHVQTVEVACASAQAGSSSESHKANGNAFEAGDKGQRGQHISHSQAA